MLATFTVLILAAAPMPRLWVPGVEGWNARDIALSPGTPALALCGDRLEQILVQVRAGRLDAGCDATFVVSGLGSLKPHRVARAHWRARRWLRSSPAGPASVVLRLGERTWRIDRIRVSSTGYRLVLRAVGERSAPVTLYEAQSTDAARWQVLWAGDLDGDRRLDLLIEASDAADWRELHLFLSRGTEELVDEAAWSRVRSG
ncbi:MAG: hypothetical protein IRZ16_15810 [Myxococcaceae bacterium]|nr:hypothetical protein [Myxococcaceae bacterium]